MDCGGRLPEDVIEDFRSSGTSHLLAISGLHVGTVLALTLSAGAWMMGRRRQLYLLLPLASIWLYALLSGLSPSAERAAIMGSIYLLGLAIGRPRSILPALALAAAVMAGLDPHVLKQVSFQLSFTAVAGIALLTTSYQPLWDYILGFLHIGGGGGWRILARGLALAVAVSVAATLATLPLIAFNFHRIPTVGVLATVLALPALPLLLLTSALSAVGGVVHPMVGEVVGWVDWVPLEYVLRIVDLVSRVSGSTVSVPAFSGLLVWVYYAILAVLLLAPGGAAGAWGFARRLGARVGAQVESATAGNRGLPFPVAAYLAAAISLSFLSAILWFYVATRSDERLHVYFLDVGQGDSVLIVTPEGRQLLVDGGPGAIEAAQAVGDRLPFWDRDLDLVMLTHPDEDHFRGLLGILDRYGVDMVLESGGVSENPLYLEWERALEGEETHRITAAQGQAKDLGGGTWLQVLSPPLRRIGGTGSDTNNNGVVLRLVYGGVSFLLTADIEAEAESRLVREGVPLRSSVLKVPHHGSKTSTTAQFLAAVSPAAAVISAGADNQYGHPHREVTGRLEASLGGDRTYITAERGDIEFITDGERLWVRTQR